MGVAYDTGRGVPEDDAEAVKWLTKAAAQDLAIAQGYLGSMYYRGEGVAKDEIMAETWYRRGALRGDLNSQDNMGRLYSQGNTPKLRAEGYAWFSLAASGGHEGSRRILEKIERRLSDAEREQGKKMLEGYKKQIEETAGKTSRPNGQKFRERSLSNFTQPIIDSKQRHKARGFSVFAPSGEDWTIVYIEGIKQEGETNIKFVKDVIKKSLFGKVKKFALMIARGSLHHLDGRTFREPKELLTFVQGMEGYKEGPRQQNLKFNMKLDNSPGAMCVRFDGSGIDPWASRRTGKTMLGELSGYHCVHPDAPWVLVTVEYLQKHWENTAVDATRLEGEHFLKSLRFTPLP